MRAGDGAKDRNQYNQNSARWDGVAEQSNGNVAAGESLGHNA